MLQEHQGRVLRFGIFEANLPARELRKHRVRIRLPGQPFCILSMLLEKPGEVVTREEMRQKLWASDTFVDFENSLNSGIKKLRAALGDSPENSRYIETIPRVGYRFIAPVEAVSPAAPLPMGRPVVTDVSAPTGAAAHGAGKYRWRFLFAAFLMAIVVPAGYFAWSRLRSRPLPHTQIASKVGASVVPNNSTASFTKSAEARDLYLKGMYFWSKRTVTGFKQSIECFKQATTLDPNYSLAYAGLANAYTLLTAYSSASATLYMPQARAAALRSLQLDDHLAEGHAALALIVQNYDWDWETSEKEYRRASELDPSYATAHQWYAEHLMWLGRFDEALAESERARNLDPLSLIIATDHGAILYYSRQYDGAIAQLRTVLQKEPGFGRAAALITFAYAEKGMFAEALAEAEVMRGLYGEGLGYWSGQGYIYGRAGQPERARRDLEKLEKLGRREQMDTVALLSAHLGAGDKEEALADLERAYSEHSAVLTALKVDPIYDPLRSDSRFQDLLRRVGLAAAGPNAENTQRH